MNTIKVKAGDLIIDPKLTELRSINEVVVSQYRQHYREGAQFPFIVIQHGTNRVVSGNHRLTAMLAEYGDDHDIDVEVRIYSSEADVLKDFAEENSKHGYPLDTFTKKKLTSAMIKEGVSPMEISKIFNISVQKIMSYGEGSVAVIIGGTTDAPVTEQKPAKKGFNPPGPVTTEAYEEHTTKDRGISIKQQVSQLVRWLDDSLIDNNQTNTDLLLDLRNSIDKFLA